MSTFFITPLTRVGAFPPPWPGPGRSAIRRGTPKRCECWYHTYRCDFKEHLCGIFSTLLISCSCSVQPAAFHEQYTAWKHLTFLLGQLLRQLKKFEFRQAEFFKGLTDRNGLSEHSNYTLITTIWTLNTSFTTISAFRCNSCGHSTCLCGKNGQSFKKKHCWKAQDTNSCFAPCGAASRRSMGRGNHVTGGRAR